MTHFLLSAPRLGPTFHCFPLRTKLWGRPVGNSFVINPRRRGQDWRNRSKSSRYIKSYKILQITRRITSSSNATNLWTSFDVMKLYYIVERVNCEHNYFYLKHIYIFHCEEFYIFHLRLDKRGFQWGRYFLFVSSLRNSIYKNRPPTL